MEYLQYIKNKIASLGVKNVIIFPINKRHRPLLWKHYCEVEGCSMNVGLGEECNWCGMKEEDSLLDNK